MKKYKKTGLRLIWFWFLVIGIQSCNIAGLDLQKNYVYKADPVHLKLNVTAYQFIESRKNIDMSLLYEAINKVGLRDSFEVQNRTYIVMNDAAFSSYLTDNKFAGLNSMSIPQLTTLLKRHIILGKYLSLSLTINTTALQTVDPATKINLYLTTASVDTQNKYRVNAGFVGSTTVQVATSNLQPTNGVMHVFGSHL
jgi:uncharacterized surface protein with fasciclin (FAS1) repeats